MARTCLAPDKFEIFAHQKRFFGGKHTEGYSYAGSDKFKQVGRCGENSGHETKVVGRLRSNELSIYDTGGNVWGWCEDDYHGYGNAPIDGSARINSHKRGYFSCHSWWQLFPYC